MGLPHFFQVRQPFLQAALSPSLFESLTKKKEHSFRYTLPFGGELGIFPVLPHLSPRFARCHVGENSPPDCFLPQAALAPSLFESLTKKKEHSFRYTLPFGGELGIRTLGTLRTQHFECCTFDHSDNSPCIRFSMCRGGYTDLHIATDILSKKCTIVNRKNKK